MLEDVRLGLNFYLCSIDEDVFDDFIRIIHLVTINACEQDEKYWYNRKTQVNKFLISIRAIICRCIE